MEDDRNAPGMGSGLGPRPGEQDNRDELGIPRGSGSPFRQPMNPAYHDGLQADGPSLFDIKDGKFTQVSGPPVMRNPQPPR